MDTPTAKAVAAELYRTDVFHSQDALAMYAWLGLAVLALAWCIVMAYKDHDPSDKDS